MGLSPDLIEFLKKRGVDFYCETPCPFHSHMVLDEHLIECALQVTDDPKSWERARQAARWRKEFKEEEIVCYG